MLVKLLKDPTDPTWVEASTVTRVEVEEHRRWLRSTLWWIGVYHSTYPWVTFIGDYETEAAAIAAIDGIAHTLNRSPSEDSAVGR